MHSRRRQAKTSLTSRSILVGSGNEVARHQPPRRYRIFMRKGSMLSRPFLLLSPARLIAHFSGTACRAASLDSQIEFVHSERFDTLGEARTRENQLKRWPPARGRKPSSAETAARSRRSRNAGIRDLRLRIAQVTRRLKRPPTGQQVHQHPRNEIGRSLLSREPHPATPVTSSCLPP